MAKTVDVDTRGLQRLARELESASRDVPKELGRARKSLQRKAKTRATDAVKKSPLNTTKKRIKQDVRVRTRGDLAFDVVGIKRPISLLRFGARELKSGGVSVREPVDGGRFKVKEWFIARGRRGRGDSRFSASGGARLVFERVGKARLPIEPFFGPSVADRMNTDSFEKQFGKEIFDAAENELNRRLLRKLRR